MDKTVNRFGGTASRWVGWGLPIIGLLLLITAGIGAFGTISLFDSEADVQHSNEVYVRLERVLALARDAETGQRGYVITGRDDYLEPYRDAEPKLERQLDQLSSLLQNDPPQMQRLARLPRDSMHVARLRWTRSIRLLPPSAAR